MIKVDFEETLNHNGSTIFKKEVEDWEELKEIINESDLKKLEQYSEDENEYIVASEQQTGYIFGYHEYLGGIIFQTFSDFLEYHKDYLKEKKDTSERAFFNRNGELVTYRSIDKDSVNKDLEWESNGRYFQVSKQEGYLVVKGTGENEFYKFKKEQDLVEFTETGEYSIFYGVQRYDEKILDLKKEIIQEQLIEVLGFEGTLDFSNKSIHELDEHIDDIYFKDSLFLKIFLGLTLYMGECLIKKDENRFYWKLKIEKPEIYVPILWDKKKDMPLPVAIYIYRSFKAEYYIAPNLWLTYDLLLGK